MEPQWPLIVFTTFIALSAGSFGTLAIVSLRTGFERIQLPGLVLAFVALVVGGGASVLHLQTPARYFGQFGNIGSGINQEIIMMALVAIMMAVYFIQLRRGGNAHPAVKVISAVFSLMLVVVMGHSYMMPSIPVWNTLLLPIYYVLNAAVLGLLVVALLQVVGKSDSGEGSTVGILPSVVVLAIFALCVAGYVAYITSLTEAYSPPLHSDITMVPPVEPGSIGERLIGGDLAVLFWGLVVIVGLVLPAFLLLMVRTGNRALIAANAVCIITVLAGSVGFRVLLYLAGASVLTY